MTAGNKSIVKLSKIALLTLVILAGAFVWVGINMLESEMIFYKVVGLFSIMFFGYAALSSLLKIFDTSPGLIIDEHGIYDNSSGNKAGMIPWNDISGISSSSAGMQKYITINVFQPERYIRKMNFPKNIFATLNNVFFESPIHISSSTLQISFDELTQLINESYEKYKNT